MDLNDMHAKAFARDLRARNRSKNTITSYLDAVTQLDRYVEGQDLADITRDNLRGFFGQQLIDYSASTAAIRHRSLRQFFKWMVREEVRGDDPMDGLPPPKVAEQPVRVLSVDDVRGLLKACDGKTFQDRRDVAMIRLFLEPGGMRLAEMAGLMLRDVDMDRDEATVLGKGGRRRVVPFGPRTGAALDRYLRLRGRQHFARLPELWIGQKGAFTPSGVAQMLNRRAKLAGLGHVHPHMLRHTAAHEWLANGGAEGDALQLFGWRSRDMLSRYGASAAAERARDAARDMNLGGRY